MLWILHELWISNDVGMSQHSSCIFGSACIIDKIPEALILTLLGIDNISQVQKMINVASTAMGSQLKGAPRD